MLMHFLFDIHEKQAKIDLSTCLISIIYISNNKKQVTAYFRIIMQQMLALCYFFDKNLTQ